MSCGYGQAIKERRVVHLSRGKANNVILLSIVTGCKGDGLACKIGANSGPQKTGTAMRPAQLVQVLTFELSEGPSAHHGRNDQLTFQGPARCQPGAPMTVAPWLA